MSTEVPLWVFHWLQHVSIPSLSVKGGFPTNQGGWGLIAAAFRSCFSVFHGPKHDKKNYKPSKKPMLSLQHDLGLVVLHLPRVCVESSQLSDAPSDMGCEGGKTRRLVGSS